MQAKSSVFVFPGQGAQQIGMGKLLSQAYPVAHRIFEQADEILGFPLSRLAWQGPQDALDDTVNTQPALMVHSTAALYVFRERYPDFQPVFVAGHSMGQLSALVASGALTFPEALKLARRRGELMKEAGRRSPGGMAAVIGLEIPTLEAICHQASIGKETVQVANDNCPGQVVISGATPALERAMKLASQSGARKVQKLAVSIAAHSPLMAQAQAGFNLAVEAAPITDPLVPIIGNVSALPLTSAEHVRLDLQSQLNSRVRWTESISYMIAQGADTFIELGSGAVLAGLIKRIDRNSKRISLGAPEDFDLFSF